MKAYLASVIGVNICDLEWHWTNVFTVYRTISSFLRWASSLLLLLIC